MSNFEASYSPAEKASFIAGFCQNPPMEYDYVRDVQTPTPWCAPWYWCCFEEYSYKYLGMSPYAAGAKFASDHAEEISEAFMEAEA